jgi:hypothetical protein
MKNRSLPGIFITIIFLLAPTLLMADSTKVTTKITPELQAYKINPHPPTIDGRLDDAIWQSPNIEKAHLAIQRSPENGMAATESTVVAVAYDDAAIYIAFWCYDSEPEKIARQLVRRDRTSQADLVTVRIDPFHDHQNGNAFEVNASGVQRDCRYYNENNSDMSWDAVWESNVSTQPWGWSAEIRIPYSCLRFSEKDEHTWGLDLIRRINRKNEYNGWAFAPSSDGGFVSNFGHLNNIKGIKPAGHTEILPYLVSNATNSPVTLQNRDGWDYGKNAGLDLKYGISTDLTLDATFNPDFGQVELDQPVLNLSAYETVFSERRPFFLEGSDLFSTPFTLFYSRRIGRPPQGNINDPEFIDYADYPNATTILGAVKLTGKLFSRTSIALLNAVTPEEKAEYTAETNIQLDPIWHTDTVSIDTVTRKGVVEPKANYTVLRVKQEILRNSSIGAIMTMVNQDGYHPALTGGLDWRLNTNNNDWSTTGQVIFSRVDNKNTGYGIDAIISKDGGKHLTGGTNLTIKSPDLRINRLGYTSRVNNRSIASWAQYRTQDKWWVIRESYNNLNFNSAWNYDGINIGLSGSYNMTIIFTNYWSLSGGGTIQAEKYSDVETRGNGLWVWKEYPTYSAWGYLGTDSRKKLMLEINPSGGTDRGGTWFDGYVGFTYRPRSNMEFSFGTNYHYAKKATYWVNNIGDQSLFADLDNDQISLRGSAGIVLNRNLSIQLSGQGMSAGLNYKNPRYYLGDNNYSASDPNQNYYGYNYTALNSTLLIRWEYRPGSTLYLVWTRAASVFDDTVNNLDISRDINRMFSGDAENLFLVKASYWMNI